MTETSSAPLPSSSAAVPPPADPALPSSGHPSPTTSTSSHTSGSTAIPGVPRPQLPPRTRTTVGTNASASMMKALEGIRAFLASKSCYDILPESFRLIVFDNKLGITKSLQALVTNGVVSAPLYDSTTHRFAGMFTLADVVHLIQYYYLTAHEYGDVVKEVEAFQLESLRQIEQAIDVPPPPTISVHPDQPLSDACAALVRTHARRLPLVDRDDQTGKETIISVLTQYRVLKFIAINCAHDCARLDMSIGSLGIGSYCSFYEPPPDPSGLSAPSSAAPSAATSPSEGPSLAASVSETLEPLAELPAASSSAAQATREQEMAEAPVEGAGAAAGAKEEGGSGTTSRGADTPVGSHAQSAPAASSSAAAPEHESEHEPAPMGVSDRFWPLSTATMQTSVFDVVHIFSERGISAVPIVDEDGVVLNLYETVDIVDLVRQNAYQVLDSTIADAINQRSPDFTGVMTCTPADSLASILTFVRDRRCHRFVIVEPEDVPARNGKPARKKGSLVGVLSLSDVLRFLVGYENLKGLEVPGLGVHGLRGVKNPTLHASGHISTGTETDTDAMSILTSGRDTDAASSVGGPSRTTSRRGSEAASETGGAGVGGRELAQQLRDGLGLEDVVEGVAVE
ncbi:hypothetical protein JCM10207_000419 [Rhodosporidiobolus poonsookiae]